MSREGRNGRRAHGARRRRTWAQRGVLVFGVLSALSLAATASGLGYVYRKVSRIPRVELSSVLDTPKDSGGPQNYLIVGVDNADRLAPGDPVRTGRDDLMRSDTIMVLRIDPAQHHALLLSLPRDLWVPYPLTHDEGRINTAIQRGGGRPDVLIAVLNDYFGIPIHHYVQVDFRGFRDLVDAIGGVPLWFPHPARDTNSGLEIMQSGCVTLDPVQALAYARSRHYQELIDGRWKTDPSSDLGRIRRQQEFIRRALDRAISKGARNPGTLNRLLNVALDTVTVDNKLTTGDILDLAQRFRSFDPQSLQTYSVPVERDFIGGADILRLLQAEAEPTLALFRGTAPSDPTKLAPSMIPLAVLNGTGSPNEASTAADALSSVGFSIVSRGDDPLFGRQRTTIRYPAGQRAAAEYVARWLVNGADLEELPADGSSSAAGSGSGSGSGFGSDVSGVSRSSTNGAVGDVQTSGGSPVGSTGLVVVTGADWAGVASTPAPAPSTTSTTPTSTSSTSTTLPPDFTDGTASTTTTVPPNC
jgi:LCP family protein required for cell wall assembly